MDAFLSRRAADPRFQNERRVSAPGAGQWYLAEKRPTRSSHHTFSSCSSGYDENHKMTPHKDDKGDSDSGRKKKKPKTKDTSYEFAMKKGADGKMKLTDGETSDNSDGGVCWSDYERVPGTKAGEKGSCRPKGSKKD